MSIEKLQTWLKNSNKFKAPLDLNNAVEGFIQNLKKLKEMAPKADNKDEVSTLLGKMIISIVEIANKFDLNIDTLLKDKFKLLDGGAAGAPKNPLPPRKTE